MKPDWEDAPEWATHLAMDCFGDWWWYEHEPEIGETLCGHGFAWQRETTESKVALAGTANEFVETSLEKRPDHIPDASKMMEPNWIPPQHGSVVANPDAKEWLRITANHGILLRVGDEMVPLDDLVKGPEDED